MTNALDDDDDIPATDRKVSKSDNSIDVTSVAGEQLKSVIERIENLEEDKKAIADDIKEVYGEAKSNGFDVTIIRKIISLRKKAAAERAEEDAILECYMQALGMIA